MTLAHCPAEPGQSITEDRPLEPKRSLHEMIAALKADPLGWSLESKLEPSSEVRRPADTPVEA